MFKCESFLKKKNIEITNLEDVISNPDKYFTNISNLTTNDIMSFSGRDYLEGAIILKYYDEVLLGFKNWDLIDQLWAYFLNMIEEYQKKGSANIYFPDQPIELNMRNVSPKIIVFEIDNKRWLLPETEFIKIILDSAEYFFKKLKDNLFNNKLYEFELKKIEKLFGLN